MRVHDAPDGPDRAGLALDPDHDPLLPPGIVDAMDYPLGEPTAVGRGLHAPTIQSRCGPARRRAQKPVLLPLRTELEGGPGRRVHHPGAPPRTPAGGLACHDLLEFVHLEPVEHPGLDRLDQVRRLEPRVLDRVAADEARALEYHVVELAAAAVVCTDRAHERARPQPLAPEHRVRGARDRDDDVALRWIAVALARLGAVALAELGQAGLRAA